MIRVLIADDHQLIRDGLMKMLADYPDIEVIGAVSTGKEVLSFLETKKADIVLMDINMPEMDGVEATARVTKVHPHVKVLALTMLEQGSFIQLMLRNGALGYLSKNTSKEELLEAIHTVFAGKRYLGEHATHQLLANISKQQTGARVLIPALTRRERDVLKLIMQGMSDTEIAGTLFISSSTAESHRKNLRSKLGARNSAEIVRIAMERGLI